MTRPTQPEGADKAIAGAGVEPAGLRKTVRLNPKDPFELLVTRIQETLIDLRVDEDGDIVGVGAASYKIARLMCDRAALSASEGDQIADAETACVQRTAFHETQEGLCVTDESVAGIADRRFGTDHGKPCAMPSVTECALWECQSKDRCRMLPAPDRSMRDAAPSPEGKSNG